MTRRTGRHVTSRVRARGWLRTESPVHVGGLGTDPSEPLPIALDGLGRPYVPGTTLAGVLRSWSRGVDPNAPLHDLWGTAGEDDGGGASRVIVADALVTSDTRLDGHGLPANPLDRAFLEFRHSVGIDRVTGTAASEFLYGRQVVAAGCFIRLEIDIETAPHSDPAVDEARLEALLMALSAGEIRIGAATSRGLGSVRLLDDPLEVVVDRFDSPQGLLAVVRGDAARARSRASLSVADPELPARREFLHVKVGWRPLAPVMVRATPSGLTVDTLPLTARVDQRHLTLVLPGGSLKGVLRSHAEFVERTARFALDDPPASAAPQAISGDPVAAYSTAFRAQLDQLPAVRALFGGARDDVKDRRAGALRAEECKALITIPEALWQIVTGADPLPTTPAGERAELPTAVRDRLDDLGMAQADHVALDRWTGGAADGRLFSVLEPHAVEWEPIRLSIDLSWLADGREPALALLLLTLRDLADGRVPLGASVNRGFGDIEVSEITLVGGPWQKQVTLHEALNGAEISTIARAWTDYLAQEVS
ncbi:RAMP superfamily CRISPR-associated protein [Microtetraspora fusca]|uniref:RAMP superfamily CRISPR-associated protein n=1 Tax=Microtetraspora fusca TaxID=1997 RepID=UPI00082B525A|nr:RAMP superfamily CRISPR-associated protein [Microtetraspora fusca]